MDKAELLERTKIFSLRILKVTDALPKATSARAIGNQLIRSATSIGANYRAASRARSHAEFAAKIGTVAEEADETIYWLELLSYGGIVPAAKLQPLMREANELTAIFTSARRTSSRNQTSNIKP